MANGLIDSPGHVKMWFVKYHNECCHSAAPQLVVVGAQAFRKSFIVLCAMELLGGHKLLACWLNIFT